MWTINYSGMAVHGYCDRALCRIDLGGFFMDAKSLHAAKCLITKFLVKAYGVEKARKMRHAGRVVRVTHND